MQTSPASPLSWARRSGTSSSSIPISLATGATSSSTETAARSVGSCKATSARSIPPGPNNPSIQAALDANPNRMVFVPPGDHVITEKIRIRGNRSGLYGPGCIIQTKADRPIIEIENATQAEIRDLTLTRPEGAMETRNEGILAIKCRDLVIDNVRVIDNRTSSGAITLRESRDSHVSHCLVRNYMRVSVDDRTKGNESGYAFNCTDGTGIDVAYCTGTLIEGNRVIEEDLLPTPEIKERFKLGNFVKKNPNKGPLISQQAWDAGYTDNWRQGSCHHRHRAGNQLLPARHPRRVQHGTEAVTQLRSGWESKP